LASCRYTTLKKPWSVEFTSECLVFEVCQPHQAKKVLDQDMSVSTVLPCRISLYEEGGKTILATLRPTTMLAMFNVPQRKAWLGKWRTQLSKSYIRQHHDQRFSR